MNPFEPGDLVQLKAHCYPPVVVERVAGDKVRCLWFHGGQCLRGWAWHTELMLAPLLLQPARLLFAL